MFSSDTPNLKFPVNLPLDSLQMTLCREQVNKGPQIHYLFLPLTPLVCATGFSHPLPP